MDSATELSIAFIEKHPIAAGRALSELAPESAATFLDAIPTSAVTKVFTHLGAWPAASILMQMSRAGAVATLRQMPYVEAVAVLRLVRDQVRTGMMAELPKGLRREFLSSLAYPEGTVGAHMTTAIVALDPRHTVGDVRRQLANAHDAEADLIIVADAERRFVGGVAAGTLLRHGDDVCLADIMDQTIEQLAPRAPLNAVAAFDAWEDYAHLPVVDRQRRVLGALSHRALRRDSPDVGPTRDGDGSIAASLTETFMSSVWGLAGLLIEDTRPRSGREADHER